jgi:hypothetical protein
MLADSGRKTVFGRLEGPPQAASILTVIAFVQTQLLQFSKKYTGSAINALLDFRAQLFYFCFFQAGYI